MNIQSIILLATIITITAIIAYRYIRRQKRNGTCGSCNCDCSCNCNCN